MYDYRDDFGPYAEPPAPPEPEHLGVLLWLDHLVGGRAALEALHDGPLGFDEAEVPPLSPEAGAIVGRARELVDTVCDRFFDDEARAAMHRCLVRAVRASPRLLQRKEPAAHLAAGAVWAVGRANDLTGVKRGVTQTALAAMLGVGRDLQRDGDVVRRAVCGMEIWPVGRPTRCPDLLVLGEPDLLVSSIRRQLVTVRDRAFAAHEMYVAVGRVPEAHSEPAFYRAG